MQFSVCGNHTAEFQCKCDRMSHIRVALFQIEWCHQLLYRNFWKILSGLLQGRCLRRRSERLLSRRPPHLKRSYMQLGPHAQLHPDCAPSCVCTAWAHSRSHQNRFHLLHFSVRQSLQIQGLGGILWKPDSGRTQNQQSALLILDPRKKLTTQFPTMNL